MKLQKHQDTGNFFARVTLKCNEKIILKLVFYLLIFSIMFKKNVNILIRIMKRIKVKKSLNARKLVSEKK